MLIENSVKFEDKRCKSLCNTVLYMLKVGSSTDLAPLAWKDLNCGKERAYSLFPTEVIFVEPVAVNNLANIEALLNIMANGCEILGIASGAPSALLSWIPFACGCYGYSLKLFFASLALVIVGLAVPGCVNWAVATGGPGLGLGVAAICSLITGALVLLVFFYPTIIAFRRQHKDRVGITILNFCFFIPFSPQIALVWASRGKAVKLEDGLNINEHREAGQED